jgi:putative methyltransferase (TIGR04325 family)
VQEHAATSVNYAFCKRLSQHVDVVVGLIKTLRGSVDALAHTRYFREKERQQALDTFRTNRDQNLFLGAYDSWEAASAAAAALGRFSYDNEESAAIYDHRTRIDTYDYPALCWLLRSMQDGHRSVADVGGSIGIKFLAFRDALANWPELRWTVYDVPAAVARGRVLAIERGPDARLQFADAFDALQGCDILYTSGVLQYLPQSLGEMLAGWTHLPRRIVINTTPICPGQDFFTVNSIGTAFCPYRVQSQAVLIRGLSKLGFRLRETWINPDKQMTIALSPELSLRHYSGFCLDRVR